MNDDEKMIAIYAAVGPNGEIVRSSIGSFRAAAIRFANQRKNFNVVKIAEISPTIIPQKPKPVVEEYEPQILKALVEVPEYQPKRRYIKRMVVGGRPRKVAK